MRAARRGRHLWGVASRPTQIHGPSPPPPPRRILASMDHPFILRLIATYQDEGELYMLLEIGSGARPG